MKNESLIVIGGGPAGLTAAYLAVQAGIQTTVLEKESQVGGISRTEDLDGYKFDIGGHRYYTKDPDILNLWSSILGDDLLQVDRLSRINYQGQYFAYPIELLDVLRKMGLVEILKILCSYLKAKLQPRPGDSYQDWMVNRFGYRLYRKFFKTYTEKVWGISGSQIQADWASQRIRSLSIQSMIGNLLNPRHPTKSLIPRFFYPVFGSGMMWQEFQTRIESLGGDVQLQTEVKALVREGTHLTGITLNGNSTTRTISADQIISSMPIKELINSLVPKAPPDVLQAANNLHYRDYILVGLVLDQVDLFPDQWLYIHSPHVLAGRIQNFKNWSAGMVPDSTKTTLGIEYFCNRDGELWKMNDSDLLDLAVKELVQLDLIQGTEVQDGLIIRQPQAYPVYDENYHKNMARIRTYLERFDNLQTIGRNGMHRYNNMDHSMLTAMLAVRNLAGANHDLWHVNTDQEYGEIVQ